MQTKKLVNAAMLSALCCLATAVIKLPSPIGGYINLGDCMVLLSGWMLSPLYGFLAAGIGSALADIFLGYAQYAPATFLIKGLMALVAFYGFVAIRKGTGELTARVVSGILAELVMITGYYVFEGFLFGFIAPLANVLPNAIQGIVGLVLGIALIKGLEKVKR